MNVPHLSLSLLQKVVEEEKQEHVDKVKGLLGWVKSFKENAQFKSIPPKSKELGNIEKSILQQQVLEGRGDVIPFMLFACQQSPREPAGAFCLPLGVYVNVPYWQTSVALEVPGFLNCLLSLPF